MNIAECDLHVTSEKQDWNMMQFCKLHSNELFLLLMKNVVAAEAVHHGIQNNEEVIKIQFKITYALPVLEDSKQNILEPCRSLLNPGSSCLDKMTLAKGPEI